MARDFGITYTCDRCKSEQFIRTSPRDNLILSLPNDWGSHEEIGDLCPSCERVYKDYIRRFASGPVPEFEIIYC